MRKSWRGKRSTVDCRLWYIVIMLLLLNCSSKDTSEKDTYTCPMHPTVVSDKHGTCPVCGMDLVRKARAGEEIEITEELAQLLQSPNEAIISNVSTIKGKYQSLSSAIEVQGIVTYDTRYVYTISSRVSGRLENVLIKSAFQSISKGQKIADIYSPELITAQRELLYLLDHDADNTSLIEAAKEKLGLMGLTSTQLSHLIKIKETTSTFSIYSSFDGYIINESKSTPASTPSSAMNGGMNPEKAKQDITANNKNVLLRAGDYVSAGQTLFKIVNTSALRVELSLPAAQANTIKVNDKIEIALDNKTQSQGVVDFIQPYTENGEELIRIRLYMNNKNDLRIGQLLTATIQNTAQQGLWIPDEAVLDLGSKQVVFIKNQGVFKAKEIKTGAQSSGWIEVKGLSSSEEIASDAHYLVDSEDLIKTLN